jgi:hypothetical protein
VRPDFGQKTTLGWNGGLLAQLPATAADDTECGKGNTMYGRANQLLALLLVVATLLGCASQSNNTPAPPSDASLAAVEAATPQQNDLVLGTLLVPQDFTAVPSFLRVSFYASIPPVGMPVAFGDRVSNPALVPGQEFPITTTQAGLTGQYYLTVVIYCQGGGDGRDPIAGIDWVGMSEQPLVFGPGTGTLDAGKIVIIPY